VKNRPFWEVFPAPEEVEAVQEAFFDLIAGDFSQSWQIDWVAKDGSRRLIAWSNTAFLREDGSVEYVIGTGIDISEHREVEKRLQRLNGKLEHQIQAEPRFAWELPVAGWERGSYNAAVFHDFRVPLRWLSGYCRALEQCSAGRLDRKGRKYLHRLRRMIQQMEDFIEVSRQQARLTRTGMYHQKTNLSAQARIIAAGLKRTSPARQVEFIIEKDLIATGDPIMLRAVLQNLLGNAWRFTEEVPRGRIEFGAWHPKNCSSGFFVRDNRTDFGIPSGPKLFRSFQRLQTIRDFSGSDLSLAAVRRIILRHGGRIWAEGAMGQGVTFYFTLPNPPPVIDQDTATGDQPNPRTG
jgi:light-regulated signal transduction histidine kinase (bacteriophytochrome)